MHGERARRLPFQAALVFLFAAPAWAQHAPLPYTAPLTVNGKQIGTVTQSGNRLYLRNLQGEHYGTVEIGPDGKRTAYDASGNVVHQIKPK